MSVRALKCDLSVLGTGLAVPGKPMPTEELVQRLHRLGVERAKLCGAVADKLAVRTRFFCRDLETPVETPREGSTNPELGAAALTRALGAAGLNANDLQYLLAHTCTPHTSLPPNAGWVADLLQFDGPYAELRQACTGFANALVLALGMCASEPGRPVGIVGSETGSVYLDLRRLNADRGQLVSAAQMGDGAGAVVLAHRNGHTGSRIIFAYYGSLGHGKKPGLTLHLGGSWQPYDPKSFQHDFEHVKTSGPALIRGGLEVAREAGIDLAEIDWFVPHQANGRMGEVLAAGLGLPQEKFFVCGNEFGNTGSASIWMAFHRLRESGALKPGSKTLVLGAEATKFMLGGFLYVH